MDLWSQHYTLHGRDAVNAATEMIMASVYLLNGAEGDGTDPAARRYRAFGVQSRGTPGDPSDPQTPYSHLYDAVDGMRRMLAELDGFQGQDVNDIVDMASDYTFDLMGEHDPATRAYAYAVAEVIERAREDALDEVEEADLTATGGHQ